MNHSTTHSTRPSLRTWEKVVAYYWYFSLLFTTGVLIYVIAALLWAPVRWLS